MRTIVRSCWILSLLILSVIVNCVQSFPPPTRNDRNLRYLFSYPKNYQEATFVDQSHPSNYGTQQTVHEDEKDYYLFQNRAENVPNPPIPSGDDSFSAKQFSNEDLFSNRMMRHGHETFVSNGELGHGSQTPSQKLLSDRDYYSGVYANPNDDWFKQLVKGESEVYRRLSSKLFSPEEGKYLFASDSEHPYFESGRKEDSEHFKPGSSDYHQNSLINKDHDPSLSLFTQEGILQTSVGNENQKETFHEKDDRFVTSGSQEHSSYGLVANDPHETSSNTRYSKQPSGIKKSQPHRKHYFKDTSGTNEYPYDSMKIKNGLLFASDNHSPYQPLFVSDKYTSDVSNVESQNAMYSGEENRRKGEEKSFHISTRKLEDRSDVLENLHFAEDFFVSNSSTLIDLPIAHPHASQTSMHPVVSPEPHASSVSDAEELLSIDLKVLKKSDNDGTEHNVHSLSLDMEGSGEHIDDGTKREELSRDRISGRLLSLFVDFNETSTPCKTPKEEPGHCRHFRNCVLPGVLDNFNIFLQYLCLIRGRYAGICCPDNPVTEIVNPSMNSSSNGNITDAVKISLPPNGCGVNSKTRIVGGSVAKPREWSWMVALLRRKKFYCGGVIINNWYVLTAAHCTLGLKIGDITVRVGEYHFLEGNGSVKHDISVAEIKRHSQFTPLTFQHDIALLKLSRAVAFRETVGAICLPNDGNDFVDTKATVIGWGTVSFGGAMSPVLRQVTVPVWKNEDCEKVYWLLLRSNETFLCAGSSEKGQDACQGDSGGPLMSLDDEDRWAVIGIVSWGRRCGDPNYPGVYTRVTSYLDWIKKNAI